MDDPVLIRSLSILIENSPDAHFFRNIEPFIAERMPIPIKMTFGYRGRVDNLTNIRLKFMTSTNVQNMPENWHRLPLARIYIIKCDDLEHYKIIIRPFLKTLMEIAEEKNQSWMVIYLGERDDDVNKRHSNIFKMVTRARTHKTIYERVMNDFFKDKPGDRSVCLDVFDEATNLWSAGKDVQWIEFFNILANCVNYSLQDRLSRYDSWLLTMSNARSNPGWNYCSYFTVKEGLAFCYYSIGLFDCALEQYNQLEQEFFTILYDVYAKKGGDVYSHIGMSFASDVSGYDSVSILDYKQKDYRRLIFENKITVIDFFQYLIARKAELLILLSSRLELTAMGSKYISLMTQELRRNGGNEVLIHSWIYSVSIELVDIISKLTEDTLTFKIETEAGCESSIEAVLGNIICQGRRSLAILGSKFGIVSDVSTRENTISKSSSTLNTIESVSNPIVLSALKSQVTWESIYVSISCRAVAHYKNAKRFRFVCRLENELSLLFLRNGDFEHALPLLKNVCATYKSDKWYVPYFATKTLLAQCERALNRGNDFVLSCLDILGAPLSKSDNANIAVCKGFQQGMEVFVTSNKLKEKVVHQCNPIILVDSISFKDTNLREGKVTVGHTLSIKINLKSNLPSDFIIQKIHLRWRRTSMSPTKLSFHDKPQISTGNFFDPVENVDEIICLIQENVAISPGMNTFTTELTPKHDGTFMTDVFWIVLGDLSLFEFVNHRGSCQLVVSPLVASLSSSISPSTLLISESSQCLPFTLSWDHDLGIVMVDNPIWASLWIANEDGIKYDGEHLSTFVKEWNAKYPAIEIKYKINSLEIAFVNPCESPLKLLLPISVPKLRRSTTLAICTKLSMKDADNLADDKMILDVMNSSSKKKKHRRSFSEPTLPPSLSLQDPHGFENITKSISTSTIAFNPLQIDTYTCTTCGSSMFLSIVIQCSALSPINLLSYSLVLPSNYALLVDPNPSLDKILLRQSQSLCLSWQISSLEAEGKIVSSNSPTSCSFSLSYTIPNALKWEGASYCSEPFTWSYPLALNNNNNSLYTLSLLHKQPENIFVGAMIEFQIIITHNSNNNNNNNEIDNNVICEISGDDFFVFGLKRFICDLKRGEFVMIVKLMALKCGLLPYPDIALYNYTNNNTEEEINSKHIWNKSLGRSIKVYPLGSHTTGLE